MLVLSRKKAESLHIGQDITVTVLSIGSGRVRLAIEAPLDVSILRDELAPDNALRYCPTAECQQINPLKAADAPQLSPGVHS